MGKNNLTERVRGIITAARTQTLEYQPRPDSVIDWPAYDAAKTQELPDVLRLIRRFVGRSREPDGAEEGAEV